MSAPISKDIQWQHTASKVFSHMHTCSVSPSYLTLHSGSCVPLGMSHVIHLFKAVWFMSAFRGREKGTHFHLLCLAVASRLVIGQMFFWTNGDGLLTGAHVNCQGCWIIPRLNVSIRKVFYLSLYIIYELHCLTEMFDISFKSVFYKWSNYLHLWQRVVMKQSRQFKHKRGPPSPTNTHFYNFNLVYSLNSPWTVSSYCPATIIQMR